MRLSANVVFLSSMIVVVDFSLGHRSAAIAGEVFRNDTLGRSP